MSRERSCSMSTAATSSSTSLSTTQQVSAKGHIGLVVLASIAAGLALGVVLVLGAFAGGDEPRIIGSALLALGGGFVLLAIASTRFTSQPQPWALVPGMSAMLAGVTVTLAAGGRFLDLAGWVWPALLAMLVVSS